MSAAPGILTINGGSSSLRFAWFLADAEPRLLLRGKVDRIGLVGAHWEVRGADGTVLESHVFGSADRLTAMNYLFDWIKAQPGFAALQAVAHRVVHGMAHSAPALLTEDLVDQLRRHQAIDPEHLPFEIDLIDSFRRRYPALLQVACFDTAFHRDMPRVAKLLPIPRSYQAMGVERYGFHGLSYAYLLHELDRLGDPSAKQGRLILAHLGNGASLAAVLDGRSVDTSMGFTPASGIMMGTRSGDLDPGLAGYLARSQAISVTHFQHMVNHESGLLGVSETSADMRDLLTRESHDERAAEAVALFCYQAKKCIGAYAAALGGVDTVVFTGGIGENAPPIRSRICAGLEFLGIELDATRNEQSAEVISTDSARVKVRVIRTDEELVLARLAAPHVSTGATPA